MVTISFQMIVTLVLTNWLGFTHGPDGIPNIPRPAVRLGLAERVIYLGLCLWPCSWCWSMLRCS